MIIEDWGRVEYSLAYARQKELVEKVASGAPDHLIFCEHPPVLTLGRMTKPGSLLYERALIEARGVAITPVDRGGDVTLHAPGQLVVYPIFNLNRNPSAFPGEGLRAVPRDLTIHMVKLEQVAVDLLRDFGILAISISGQRGVFVGDKKIVSIGVGLRKWVTYHGLGINVNTDLSLFNLIKPCGLDVRMTSIKELKGREVPLKDVKAKMIEKFIL